LRAPQSPYAIHLRDIAAEGLHRDYDLAGAFAEEVFEGTEVDPARVTLAAELDLHRTGHEVLARGALSGEVVALCSRCAGPAHITVDAPLEALFVPRGVEPKGEAEDGDLLDQPEVVAYDDDIIDLKETLREELLVALPIAPLCREDCKGLCAHCGKELNEGPCGCAEEPKDDRWSGLKNLKLD
jgi:uncharacterized protein